MYTSDPELKIKGRERKKEGKTTNSRTERWESKHDGLKWTRLKNERTNLNPESGIWKIEFLNFGEP
jgi:hypothetical protein